MAIQTKTSRVDLDQSLVVLRAHCNAWAALPVGRKIPYLLWMRKRTAEVAEEWVAAAVQAKGIAPGSTLEGEEWISGPWALLYALNRLIESLRGVAREGMPPLKPGAVRTRPDGQVVVEVLPLSIYDRLLLSGITAEVWMQPEVTPETLAENMAAAYRGAPPEGNVALVLGAGNIASIPPLDLLYRLFTEGHCCLLKMNPVNAYLGPFFEQIFARLIADGYVRVAYGGAETGEYLCRHTGIDEIHITGSAVTHDAIVFGSGEEGAQRKQSGAPILNKPISSELGNVSPTIVIPGPWTKADLQFQAEHIATQKMHNAGFNCIAAQVLVLSESWGHTTALLEAIRGVLRDTPSRPAYYPGAAQRQQMFAARYPQAELLDTPGDGVVPRTLVPGVDSSRKDDICFTTEVFGDVLAATTLAAPGAAEFLRLAVAFCNETLHGTLGANIIVHPKTARELGPALEDAIADLRYGCVAVNIWTGAGFLLSQTSWGAYPGHTLADVGSGIGVVHNSFLFDKPQKSVVRGPFYPYPRGLIYGQLSLLPKPPWFITNRQAHNMGRRLTRFEAQPGPAHLPGIFLDALRG